MRLWKSWTDFWSRKEDGSSLAGFRIGIGISLLYTFGMPLWDGAVEAIWIDSDYGGMRHFKHNPWLIKALGGATPAAIYGMVTAAIISALLLIAGVLPRTSALVGMILINNIAWHNNHAGGGHDDLIANALWLLVFADSAASHSLTCRWRTGRWTSDKLVHSWPRYIALCQLLLMYSSTGWQKLSSHWIPFGEMSALWYILQQPTWARFSMEWMASLAWTTKIATLVTWFFECFSILLVLALHYESTPDRPGRFRRLFNRIQFRKIFIVIGLGMHIGIFLTMEVGPFSLASFAYYFTIRKPRLRDTEEPQQTQAESAPMDDHPSTQSSQQAT